jgi:asparagine synthase (glutamine-hydrolysing)
MAASVPCLNTAISGGYDSRLILALCLEIGATTRLHVYGRPDDADVRIARAIADALRLDVTHADKSAARQGPGCFEDNVLKFDGTPPDGIADDGADLATRIDAFADGALALNGGGGEILRDFYDLPDRRYTTRQVLAAFHRQFDARALPPAHDLNTYLDALAAKAQRAIGARAEDLSRTEIELLYGALRCRYWMGRNNSINNRFGAFVTPFIDAGLVADALRIPMAAKRLGRFEAALIRRAHPRLAGLPSAYGHAFDQAPSLGHVLDEWGALVRPTWLRGRMHRVKWAMRPRTMPPPPAPLDLDLPFMRRLLRLDHVTDDAQWRRVWALEYLFGKVDARLD